MFTYFFGFRLWKKKSSQKVLVVVVHSWHVPSCQTLCDPIDCSPPGSFVRRILLARILEWVATSFSRGSSQPRDWTQVSCIAGGFFTIWATREAHRKAIFNLLLPSIFQGKSVFGILTALLLQCRETVCSFIDDSHIRRDLKGSSLRFGHAPTDRRPLPPLYHMRVQAQADPLAYITLTGTHEVYLCVSACRGVRFNNEIKLATAGWIIIHIISSFSCPRNTGGMFKHLSLLSTKFS